MDNTEDFLKFLANNFALILSSLVSISAVIASTVTAVYQTKKQYHETSMKLYFEAQYRAYTELYEVATDLDKDISPTETRDYRALISAAKKAELVSPHYIAEIIDDFCAVYYDLLEESDNGKVSKKIEAEFRNSLTILTMYLREELRRHDSQHKRGKRLRKSLKKLYLKYNRKE